MTTLWIRRISIAAALIGALWLFLGIERVVDDHELGTSWQTFIKHRPSTKLIFQNPSQKGLEVVRYESLTPAEQVSFIGYCRVRFGIVNPEQCHKALMDRII